MTRHLADHERSNAGTRLSRYVEIARQSAEEGSHPATKAILSRQSNGNGGRRTREFVEIERGRTA